MIAPLIALRHDLHRYPDVSGAEHGTAARLVLYLEPTQPTALVQQLGGHGIAAVYDSGRAGPTILLRAELDALPIVEQDGRAHRSVRNGVAHLCGHDGHMAVLVGVAQSLHASPPPKGRVVVLFQPAEETGMGARAVLADPRFATLRPDWAFALHNMPGLPVGALAVAAGPASCASVGVRLCFQGVEAHAAFPETGRSPAPALMALLDWLAPLMQVSPIGPDFQLVTLCHMTLGIPAFGIAPAQAEVWLTLRALTDSGLDALEHRLGLYAAALAARFDLHLKMHRHDHFHATLNDPLAAQLVATAGRAAGVVQTTFDFPMRPSEDFGAFSAQTRTALFFIGAGTDCAPLHNPAYDFPDQIIAPAINVFWAILSEIWANDP